MVKGVKKEKKEKKGKAVGKEAAPGQVKKEEGVKGSAKEFAHGQVGKEQQLPLIDMAPTEAYVPKKKWTRFVGPVVAGLFILMIIIGALYAAGILGG